MGNSLIVQRTSREIEKVEIFPSVATVRYNKVQICFEHVHVSLIPLLMETLLKVSQI